MRASEETGSSATHRAPRRAAGASRGCSASACWSTISTASISPSRTMRWSAPSASPMSSLAIFRAPITGPTPRASFPSASFSTSSACGAWGAWELFSGAWLRLPLRSRRAWADSLARAFCSAWAKRRHFLPTPRPSASGFRHASAVSPRRSSMPRQSLPRPSGFRSSGSCSSTPDGAGASRLPEPSASPTSFISGASTAIPATTRS